MRYRRTIIHDRFVPAADGIVTADLPVNSLSFIQFTLRVTGITTLPTLAELDGAISLIQILHKGQAILSGSFLDLFNLSNILTGHMGIRGQLNETDLDFSTISFILPLGRYPFDPKEAFPPTTRGQLQLQVTVDIATAAFSAIAISAEAIEILDNQPSTFLKATTSTLTPAATGNNDLPLPVGNKFAGIFMFGTTVPVGSTATATIQHVRLLIDNVEHVMANSEWLSIHADLGRRVGHINAYTGALAVDDMSQNIYLDFDPFKDSDFLVETAGANDVKLVIDAGDTNVLRAIPLEVVNAALL